jgi:hypothetical protein
VDSAGRLGLRLAQIYWSGLVRFAGAVDAEPWLRARGVRWGPACRLHRGRVLIELFATAMLGALRDRLWQGGRLEAIDGEDFRDWLGRHGASDEVRRCPVIKIWYDAVVAYEDGDERAPRISAGVTMYALFRAICTYKGAFALQMTHEIGDSFIAPIVKALELRGVEIRYFHRVRDLAAGTGSNETFIHEITVEEQVSEARRMRHRPFVTMPGVSGAEGPSALPRQVWPNRPVFDEEAPSESNEADAPAGIPFDAYDHGPTADAPLTRRVLRRDQDFDEVVFALPGDVARDFTALSAHPSWVTMNRAVKSVATQSMRLWFRRSLAELGWPYPNPILSGFTPPYSTWEDNGQNLAHERFAGLCRGDEPRAIATLFGPLKTTGARNASTSPDGSPQDAAEMEGRRFFEEDLGGIWPSLGATSEERSRALVAPPGVSDEMRFAWQYRRANAGPLEAYVLALPGSLRHRLRADASGFRNLYVAGEWTRNGLEVGCVEGAVMAGLSAARAICHEGKPIIGEDDMALGPLRRD